MGESINIVTRVRNNNIDLKLIAMSSEWPICRKRITRLKNTEYFLIKQKLRNEIPSVDSLLLNFLYEKDRIRK